MEKEERFLVSYFDENGFLHNHVLCSSKQDSIQKVKDLMKEGVPSGEIVVSRNRKLYWAVKLQNGDIEYQELHIL